MPFMLGSNSCSLGAWFLFISYSVQFSTSLEPTMVEDWAEYSFGSKRKTVPAFSGFIDWGHRIKKLQVTRKYVKQAE